MIRTLGRLVVVLLLAGAVAAPSMGEVGTSAVASVPSPLKIVTLGDSITYGPVVQADRTATGYRRELGRLLGWAGVSHTFVDRSIVGGRTDHFLQTGPGGITNARAIAAEDQPDIVVVALGTNDAAAPGGVAAFEGRYRTLIAELQAGRPGVLIIAAWIQISGPPQPPTLSDNQRLINDAIYRVVYGPSAPFGSPLLAPFVGICDFNNFPLGLLTSDGVHPTEPLGYNVYGWTVYNQLAGWIATQT